MGKRMSLEARKKISQAQMGRRISPTTRKKMSQKKAGEKHNLAIVTEKEVLDIRFAYKEELERRYSDGKTQVTPGFALDLAEHYGVSVALISSVGHRFSWKHLDN